MAISKKTRFEIFKRDHFRCQYCGQTPPAVVLEVDHIQPKSKGGSDDWNNLITSCFDCNRGKSNVELGEQTAEAIMQMQYEKIAQLTALNEVLRKSEDMKDEQLRWLEGKICELFDWRQLEPWQRSKLSAHMSELPAKQILMLCQGTIERWNEDEPDSDSDDYTPKPFNAFDDYDPEPFAGDELT